VKKEIPSLLVVRGEGEEGGEKEREWWKRHRETKGCLKEEPFAVEQGWEREGKCSTMEVHVCYVGKLWGGGGGVCNAI